jgi:peptidylprolyl isomerase
VLLAGALALSACGDGSEPSDAAAPPDCSVEATEVPSEPAPDLSGEPPAELQVESLAEPPSPDCAEAVEGDLVAVSYVGRSWSTGEVFDSSEGRGPFPFQLGAGRVIAGWEQGIAGLQVGERARLTIPPDMAYGEAGAGGGAIGPGETLVFDVQLVEIMEESAEGAS